MNSESARKEDGLNRWDGLNHWRKERQESLRTLAISIGLPIGRVVEVWLNSGIRLQGRLSLREVEFFPEVVAPNELEFVVQSVSFRKSEIESCVTREEST